jgi:hypothetical protein
MTLNETERGAAERLLDLVLSSGAHLWHNRPGLEVQGTWRAADRKNPRAPGQPVAPGLFVPAAVALYTRLLEIYRLDAELMAHFASYALVETEWRDLKVAAAALMLVQSRAGAPVTGEGGAVEFYDDDYRAIGEAMILHYAKGSTKMMSPKGVLRVAELLEVPQIAALNRAAGFGDPASRKPPLGRWKSAARQWLASRERNLPLLEGLVSAGYKETIKKIARKAGYKPESQRFFEILGWAQKQSAGGHREVGLEGLELRRRERFDGLSEEEICEWIVKEKLSYKEAVGRLPAGMGLTPAIMAALLPSLSDRDLRLMTPTLESLGLLQDAEVRGRWERAIQTATDQRALQVAKNVKSKQVREKLEQAADVAAQKAVAAATAEQPVEVMFLIDKSGSMEQAIEQSKEALSRILAGFPPERLHIATFDTMGKVLRLKAPSRAAVQHLLKDIKAHGGTTHAAAVEAFRRENVAVPARHKLLVIVIGDEAGEDGRTFAQAFERFGYQPAALALICCVAPHATRGRTVRGAAAALSLPFSEVAVEAFDDPYQVPRVLQAMLDAPVPAGLANVAPSRGWLEKVLKTPLLEKP